jgi:hypothetical protein
MSLLDEVVVAMLMAVQITYVNMLSSGSYIYTFPWIITLAAGAAGALAAVILEKFRPYQTFETNLITEDISQMKSEVARIVKTGQSLAYWEMQNPLYSRVLAIGVPLLMIIVAVTAWSEVSWLSVIMTLIGIALVLIYGGFRTLVSRQTVTVRMGILGIRLLNLKMADIASSEIVTFQPLRDFGGYGIRFNKEMKAYFLSGNRGVKITTRSGRKFLVGSDHPERLNTVIRTVID